MAIGDEDLVDAAKRRRTATGQSNFPAVNQFVNLRNTAFARNAPINTIAMNAQPQIPTNYQPGSIGHNLGGSFGASFTNPFASLFNQMSQNLSQDQQSQQNQPPTLTGYHWYAGTGGVQGGNDANANLNWSNGTTTNINSPLGGLPALGSSQPVPQPQYPQTPQQYPTTAQGNVNYNVPGGSMQDAIQATAPVGQDYNASTGQYLPASTPSFMSATKGPSQFASAPRTTNQFGQQMINPVGGGQMTTDKRFPDKRNQPWLGAQSWGGY